MSFSKNARNLCIIILAAVAISGLYFMLSSGQPASRNAAPLAAANAFVLDTFAEVRIYAVSDLTGELSATDGGGMFGNGYGSNSGSGSGSTDSASPQRIADRCMELCRYYEGIFSMYDKSSELFLLNQKMSSSLSCSAELLEILDIANHCRTLSNGCFDVTIGAVTELWDFKGDFPVPPNSSDIASALQSTGSEYSVNLSSLLLNVNSPGTKFDLGGIAKGYICGKIADYLRSEGVSEAIIDLGGNIYALGQKHTSSSGASYSDSLWSVAVRDPLSAEVDTCCISYIADRAVVTSGAYERSFTYDGVLYHHILDPKTGLPVQNEIASVTVFSENAAFADAFSTAFFVMGTEAAINTANSIEETDILIVQKDGSYVLSDGIFDATGKNFTDADVQNAFEYGKIVLKYLN